MNKVFLPLSLILNSAVSYCQEATVKDTTKSDWSYHFQLTMIGQDHPLFRSPYEGKNSITAHDSVRYSLTTTLFLGRRLWKDAALYFNPEVAGGSGMSAALGLAGAANGETFRVGNPSPALYVARIFMRQYINLGGSTEATENAPNELAGTVSSKRMVITAGKFGIDDIFDNNSYSHNPRTQFLNWSLMSTGAWDYPANVRGYTYNAVAEYIDLHFAVRIASSMVPAVANGPTLDFNLTKAHSETFELEHMHQIKERKGSVRLLLFHTTAHMGSYIQTLTTQNPKDTLDITKTRMYGRNKYGISLNAEQEIGNYSGVFFRASWNDGKNETWAFTEIDQSISAGLSMDGTLWKRKNDRVGAAFVINGISSSHKQYLTSGGSGFILGDGKLNYACESILEVFYAFQVTPGFSLSPDYQFIANPGYNKDRGPVNVFALRGHLEF